MLSSYISFMFLCDLCCYSLLLIFFMRFVFAFPGIDNKFRLFNSITMLLSLKVETIWMTQSKYQFNAVTCGKLFGSKDNTVVMAGEDGIVRLFADPLTLPSVGLKLQRSLETKCGPAFHVLVRDVTRLSPCDLLVADNRGSLVLFCDGQILKQTGSVSGATSQIVGLEVQETANGQICIIAGRDNGEITCSNSFTQLWRLRLSDCLKRKDQSSVSVTCICAARIATSSFLGNESDYILVADSLCNLYVIQNGQVRRIIKLPSVVTSMDFGHFLETETVNQQDPARQPTQIALGCSDGSIRICADFRVDPTPYADIGRPVTRVRRLPAAGDYVSNDKTDFVGDLLLCAGHFSSLLVLQQGKVLHSHPLPGWPVSMYVMADSLPKNTPSKERATLEKQVLIGCRDWTLHLLSVI